MLVENEEELYDEDVQLYDNTDSKGDDEFDDDLEEKTGFDDDDFEEDEKDDEGDVDEEEWD